jgi:(2Fe-2S) ferredoxin
MNEVIERGLEKAGVAKAERHLFLCIGPDCCSTSDGERVWEYVKQRVKETGLKAMRTKAGCFRICAGGPWMVVYPEGTWYGEVTPERFERILTEHLLAGNPVQEWLVVRNDLCGDGRAR